MHLLALLVLILCAGAARGAEHVVAVSVDGMGSSYMQALIDEGRLPHFKQLQEEGAYTLNARTDHAFTVTLPNHVTMLTSRPVRGDGGHRWSHNTDPKKGMTLHSNYCAYVASVFDVAHDNGRRTGLWATKSKFSLFQLSYNAKNGAPDTTGADNGRGKLDVFVYKKTSPELTTDFLVSMTMQPCHFAFVHFAEPDKIGHASGWGSDAYKKALITVDGCLGRIMELISTHPTLKDKTTLIVTADHGGSEKSHVKPEVSLHYTIPLLAWGEGVTRGELYALNGNTRQDPERGRPDYKAQPQPIRDGTVGNLALSALGLGSIPGSFINARQDLLLAAPSASRL